MDYLKKITVILTVLLFGCALAFAASATDSNLPAGGNKGLANHPVRDYLQELSEKLNLTDTQKTAIKPILAAEANEIRTIHQDSSLSNEQKQAKTKEIRDASREKINALLTPEQQKIFAEMRGQAGNRMHEQLQNRLNMLVEKLNLTDEQKTAIKPILAEEANEIGAVVRNNSLSKEQRQTKLAAIHEASDKKINAILTPEQQVKWAQLKESAKQQREKKNTPSE